MVSQRSLLAVLFPVILSSTRGLGAKIAPTAAFDLPADLRVGDSFFLGYEGQLNAGAYVLDFFETDPNSQERLLYSQGPMLNIDAASTAEHCTGSPDARPAFSSIKPTSPGTYKYAARLRTFYGSKAPEVKNGQVCLTPPFTSEVSNSTAVEVKVSPAEAGSTPKVYNGISTLTAPITFSPAPTGEVYTVPKSNAQGLATQWRLGAAAGLVLAVAML